MYETSDFHQLNNDVNNRLIFDLLAVVAPAGDDSDAVELAPTAAAVGVAMLDTLLAGGGAGLVWQQL